LRIKSRTSKEVLGVQLEFGAQGAEFGFGKHQTILGMLDSHRADAIEPEVLTRGLDKEPEAVNPLGLLIGTLAHISW
jgi:hypothetical protein